MTAPAKAPATTSTKAATKTGTKTGTKTAKTSAGLPKALTRARPRPETRPKRPVRSRTAPLEAPPAGAPRQDRARSAAAQRGYARKAQRRAAVLGVRRAGIARRTPFVLLVMALLATGLIASLWLSTAAAADSYRLDEARREARDLTERAEQLRQDVAAMQTAPQLAQRARDLGMVPAGEPARLVVQPDGSIVVVGTPAPATAPPPVESPASPAEPPASPAPREDQPGPADGAAAPASPPARDG